MPSLAVARVSQHAVESYNDGVRPVVLVQRIWEALVRQLLGFLKTMIIGGLLFLFPLVFSRCRAASHMA